MAGTQTGAIPFTVWQVIGSSDANPLGRRLYEGASKTFKFGVPLILSSGYLQESGAITGATPAIVGFSQQPGSNLASAGVAPLGGSGTTFGSVQNQASAVNIPIGAPMADGLCGVWIAGNTTYFQGISDDAHTVAVTDVGATFGLTKDSGSGQWFIDTTITATGSGAVLECVGLVDAVGTVGGKLAVRMTNAAQALGL